MGVPSCLFGQRGVSACPRISGEQQWVPWESTQLTFCAFFLASAIGACGHLGVRPQPLGAQSLHEVLSALK